MQEASLQCRLCVMTGQHWYASTLAHAHHDRQSLGQPNCRPLRRVWTGPSLQDRVATALLPGAASGQCFL